MRTLVLKGILFTILILVALGGFVAIVFFTVDQLSNDNFVPFIILFGFVAFVSTFIVYFIPSILVHDSLNEKREYDIGPGGRCNVQRR